MSVSMIFGFGVSLITYLYAVLTGTQTRMSGNFFYDYFMGACLNPRLGSIDLKMWAEVRIPWVIVFFLSVSGACKQYETYGYVTPVNTIHFTLLRFVKFSTEHGIHDLSHWVLYQRMVCNLQHFISYHLC